MLNLILKGNTGVSHSNTHQNTVGGREGGMDDREHFSIGFHILHNS
jgi:hypothetical protein